MMGTPSIMTLPPELTENWANRIQLKQLIGLRRLSSWFLMMINKLIESDRFARTNLMYTLKPRHSKTTISRSPSQQDIFYMRAPRAYQLAYFTTWWTLDASGRKIYKGEGVNRFGWWSCCFTTVKWNVSQYTGIFNGNELYLNVPMPIYLLDGKREVSVNGAGFIGDIPKFGNAARSIIDFEKITILDLHHNAFTGPIPACIGKLVGLVELHLSSNCLEGEIPSEIGCLVNLKALALSDNSGLSGTIPTSFSNLVRLEKLWVAGINVEGPVPFDCLPTLCDLDASKSHSIFKNGFPGNFNAFSDFPHSTCRASC